MNVYILRGISGSGKSTWVKKFLAEYTGQKFVCVCSADDYLVDPERGYFWTEERVGRAHNECFKKFLNYIYKPLLGIEDIIIDNTNRNDAAMAPYVAVANAMDAKIIFVEFECPPGIAAKRNSHNVDDAMSLRQFNSFRPVPRRWLAKAELIKVKTYE